MQKRETKAINKLCVREILSLSFVCAAYFFEFRGRNLVCFVIAYNFNGKYAPEAEKTRMRTAFFTRINVYRLSLAPTCNQAALGSPALDRARLAHTKPNREPVRRLTLTTQTV